MSRTYHHSARWGRDHCFADRPDRRGRSSEAGIPSWWVTMFMHRPGRRDDVALIRLIMSNRIDADEAVFTRTGGRKPHEYYW